MKATLVFFLCCSLLILSVPLQAQPVADQVMGPAVRAETLRADIVDPIFSNQFEPAFQDCPDCPTMVVIPGGIFTQGAPVSEPESISRERPQREVTVPAFAMGQTEVTFDQWDACVADGAVLMCPLTAGLAGTSRSFG